MLYLSTARRSRRGLNLIFEEYEMFPVFSDRWTVKEDLKWQKYI